MDSSEEFTPAIWEALTRRGFVYYKDGIKMLNRKGRRWLEKQIGRQQRDALRAEARSRDASLKQADHWGESRSLEESNA